MLHCRQAICIPGHKDYKLRRSFSAESSHVQADSHIDAFLLKIGLEVLVLEGRGRDWNFLRLEASKFEDPSSHGEEILGCQFS